MKRHFGMLAWVLGTLAFGGSTGTSGGGEARFEAKGPAGMKIIGKTQEVSAQASPDEVQISVALSSLNTGIDLRDKHLREKYLHTAQFPAAVLKAPWKALQVPAEGATSQGSAEGTLTLHGQTKAVKFSYSAQRHGEQFSVKGDLPIHLGDFGIEQPKYMGLAVQPDVVAHVETVVVKP